MEKLTKAEIIAAIEANIRQATTMLSMLADELEAADVPDELRLLRDSNEKLLKRLTACQALSEGNSK